MSQLDRRALPTAEPLGVGAPVVLFGLASAAAWGAGDFAGGWASRRGSVFGIALIVQMVGFFVYIGLATVAREPTPGLPTIAISVAAGVAVAIGILGLYHGLAIGRMGVVAPVTGLLAAVLPVVAGIVRDGPPPPPVLVGILLALVAVVLVSRAPGAAGSRSGIELAVVAGAGIGAFNILVGELPAGQVFEPLIVIKLSAATVIVLALVIGRQSWRLPGRVIPIAVAGAVFDMAGNAFYVLATQVGRLDVAATLSSLYPVTTILLAIALVGERVTRLHALGIGAALAAIVLIGGGSSGA